MDERSCVEAAQRGDRQAMRQLYDRHVVRIFPLMLRMTGRHHDALDLTQETFVRAFERLSAFDGRSSFGTWLYRIAVNEALQWFRKNRTRQHHIAAAREGVPTVEPGDGIRRRVEMEDALQQLTPDHRAVLLLKYQEGLDYANIAAVLGCEPGTVASRLNRARAELRSILEGGSPGGEER